jgi:type III secretion protein L
MAASDPIAKSQLPKAPGAKIIRAGQENAWIDGFELLKTARKAHEAERTRGYTEGLEAGKQEAAKLLMATSQKVDRYLGSIEGEISSLALSIVRNVLREFDQEELVARAAANALAELRATKTVRIKVHPAAEARVRDYLAQAALFSDEQQPTVTIEADSQLNPESCILSTDAAVIEATIETQLAAIAEAMGLSGQAARQ